MVQPQEIRRVGGGVAVGGPHGDGRHPGSVKGVLLQKLHLQAQGVDVDVVVPVVLGVKVAVSVGELQAPEEAEGRPHRIPPDVGVGQLHMPRPRLGHGDDAPFFRQLATR